MRILVTGGSGFIGTNFLEYYANSGHELLNVDWNRPLNGKDLDSWVECDIMNLEKLVKVFQDFQPDWVVHLAARVDTDDEDDINKYIQNTVGTENVIKAIKATPSISRVVMTSTMFVIKELPKHKFEYKPWTLYGKTKVITEEHTRAANLDCTWTIIRPTTVWGPWSIRYKKGLFNVIEKGLYFHPSKKGVVRSYGYVKNLVWQVAQILEADPDKVHEEVFYVGDMPFVLIDWVDEVSRQLIGKPVRKVPTLFIKMLGLAGDVLTSLNISFPIISTRVKSMIEDYHTPMEKTINAFGPPPFTLEQGVSEFVRWYKEEGKDATAHPKIKVDMKSYSALAHSKV